LVVYILLNKLFTIRKIPTFVARRSILSQYVRWMNSPLVIPQL